MTDFFEQFLGMEEAPLPEAELAVPQEGYSFEEIEAGAVLAEAIDKKDEIS